MLFCCVVWTFCFWIGVVVGVGPAVGFHVVPPVVGFGVAVVGCGVCLCTPSSAHKSFPPSILPSILTLLFFPDGEYRNPSLFGVYPCPIYASNLPLSLLLTFSLHPLVQTSCGSGVPLYEGLSSGNVISFTFATIYYSLRGKLI